MAIRKSLLVLAIFIFSIPAILADFQVEVAPVKDQIVINEYSIFNITIKNYYDTEEDFRIRNFDYPVWDIFTEPLINPITIKVQPQSSSTLQVFVKSLQYAQTPVGTYALSARVDAETKGEQSPLPITVSIKSTEPLIGGYLPNIRTALDAPEEIDPRKDAVVKVSLKNLNPIKYENITVKLKSGLIDEEIGTKLEPPGEGSIVNPESEKEVEFNIKLDQLTVPQQDTLIADVFYNKRKIASESKIIKIVEYAETHETPEKESFLKSTKSVRVSSNNPQYSGSAKLEISPFKNLFTSAEPDADYAKEGKKHYLVWEVNLEGKKEIVLGISTNYRPLAIIIIIAIAVLGIYYILRSPLTLRKSISDIKKKEGGISEVKVIIRVKNRGTSELSHIEISDNVPHIADIDRDITIGSIQPAKILRHQHKGIMIRWYIEKIEGGDERVLTYTMKSRLPILGELTLQPANARYKAKGRNIITNSNRVVAEA